MKTIWKYPLTGSEEQTIEMPAEAKILCVQVQGQRPTIWAVVNPEQPLRSRTIKIYATGGGCEVRWDRSRYIGTFQLMGGALVFHAFEEIES